MAPKLHALQGGCFTTGLPGKSYRSVYMLIPNSWFFPSSLSTTNTGWINKALSVDHKCVNASEATRSGGASRRPWGVSNRLSEERKCRGKNAENTFSDFAKDKAFHSLWSWELFLLGCVSTSGLGRDTGWTGEDPLDPLPTVAPAAALPRGTRHTAAGPGALGPSLRDPVLWFFLEGTSRREGASSKSCYWTSQTVYWAGASGHSLSFQFLGPIAWGL